MSVEYDMLTVLAKLKVVQNQWANYYDYLYSI
jgi:hypothetical protein